MKNLKKTAIVGAAVLALAATSITAFAATFSTPAELLAGLTGKSVESILDEKTEENKTYGALADEYEVLDEYKAQILEEKKAYLEERVAEGTMTRERADAIIANIEENNLTCDGTGYGAGGCGMGAGFGNGNGSGVCDGTGNGGGFGQGTGYGRGAGGGGCGMGNRAARG
jgi:hypothetical protein